jgi:hypothetical protein
VKNVTDICVKIAFMKKKIIIGLMLLGSGLFLYQGFSLLFHGDDTGSQPQEKTPSK